MGSIIIPWALIAGVRICCHPHHLNHPSSHGRRASISATDLYSTYWSRKKKLVLGTIIDSDETPVVTEHNNGTSVHSPPRRRHRRRATERSSIQPKPSLTLQGCPGALPPPRPGHNRRRRRPSAAGGQDLRILAQVAFWLGRFSSQAQTAPPGSQSRPQFGSNLPDRTVPMASTREGRREALRVPNQSPLPQSRETGVAVPELEAQTTQRVSPFTKSWPHLVAGG